MARHIGELLELLVRPQQGVGTFQYALFQAGIQQTDLFFVFPALADVTNGAGDHGALFGLQRAETDLYGEFASVVADRMKLHSRSGRLPPIRNEFADVS